MPKSCFQQTLLNRIRSLDRLGENISLNIAGVSKVRTAFGACLTILCFCIFSASATLIIIGFARTDQPEVGEQRRISTSYPKIDLMKEGLLPVVFGFLDDEEAIPYEELSRYVNFKFFKRKYHAKTLESGRFGNEIQTIEMTLGPCGQIMQKKIAKDVYNLDDVGYLKDMAPTYGLCIEPIAGELYVQGKYNDEFYEGAFLEIYPCDPNITTCVDSSELERVSFVISHGLTKLNLDNYSTPMSQTKNGDMYYNLNPSQVQYYTRRYELNTIADDRSYFIPDVNRASFYSLLGESYASGPRSGAVITCSEELLKDGGCRPYISLEFTSSGFTNSINRRYKGFIETLSDIGGVRDVVYTIAFLIYAYYNDYSKKRALVAHVYRLRPESKKKKLSQENGQSSNGDNLKDDEHGLKRQKTHSHIAENLELTGNRDNELYDAPKEMIDKAYEIVEQSLDAVTIVQQINTLKLLTKFLLQDYQEKLAPFVALNIDLQEIKKKNLLKLHKKEGLKDIIGEFKNPFTKSSRYTFSDTPRRKSGRRKKATFIENPLRISDAYTLLSKKHRASHPEDYNEEIEEKSQVDVKRDLRRNKVFISLMEKMDDYCFSTLHGFPIFDSLEKDIRSSAGANLRENDSQGFENFTSYALKAESNKSEPEVDRNKSLFAGVFPSSDIDQNNIDIDYKDQDKNKEDNFTGFKEGGEEKEIELSNNSSNLKPSIKLTSSSNPNEQSPPTT